MTEIFYLTPDFGLVSTYEFKEDIHESIEGVDYVNAKWRHPIAKYNFALAYFEQSIYNYVKDFYYFQEGQEGSFLFEDPIDNQVTQTEYDTELGIVTQGIIIEYEGQYQLVKRYKLGANYVDRPITRPKSFKLYRSGVEIDVNDYDVDITTGLVTGDVEATDTWEGSFYVLVRFENESLPLEVISYDEVENRQRYALPDLRLIEVREEFLKDGWSFDTDYNHYFALPFDYGARFSIDSKVDIFTSDSGWESRDKVNNIKRSIGTSYAMATVAEKEYLVGLWRLCLGKWAAIKFSDTSGEIDAQYRFDEIPSFKTLVEDNYDEDYRLFQMDNVGFKEELGINKTTYCQIWRIYRNDEEVIGFTNHDRDVVIDDVVCASNLGMTGTASQRTAELNTDSTELSSVFLTITENDLFSGKYDNASVLIEIYDWNSQESVVVQFRGSIGGYSIGALSNKTKQYQLEALSIAEKLNVSVSRETSSECRHRFLSQGYGMCNKALDLDNTTDFNSVQIKSEVTLGGSTNTIEVGFGSDNWAGFKYGILEFISGELTGTKIYIADTVNPRQVVLLYAPPIPPQIGDEVRFTRHCPKTVEACGDYDNLANYGGFPRLPGIDLVISGADV